MRKMNLLVVAVLLPFLMACDGADNQPEATIGVPGSDRDEHGCIASAGYSWCEATGQCERPWELAAKVGFDNTKQGFSDYCHPGN